MELTPELSKFIVLLITFGTIILTAKLTASWILRIDTFIALFKEKNMLSKERNIILKEISDTLKNMRK